MVLHGSGLARRALFWRGPDTGQILTADPDGSKRDKQGKGWIRDIEVTDVGRYMSELIEFMDTRHPEILKLLRDKKDLTDDVRAAIDGALAEFRDVFIPTPAKA